MKLPIEGYMQKTCLDAAMYAPARHMVSHSSQSLLFRLLLRLRLRLRRFSRSLGFSPANQSCSTATTKQTSHQDLRPHKS